MILRTIIVFAYMFAACMTRFTMRRNHARWAWVVALAWPLLVCVMAFFIAAEMVQFWWTGEDPSPEEDEEDEEEDEDGDGEDRTGEDR
jgi:flagellar basal body-associated protein FliL